MTRSARGPIRHVHCDACRNHMYSHDGFHIVMDERTGKIPKPPIAVTVNHLELLFCSQPCMMEHLRALDTSALTGNGYPLYRGS